MIRPMNSARPNSRSARAPSRPTPTTSSDVTGSSATNEVFSDRISTWFSERFAIAV